MTAPVQLDQRDVGALIGMLAVLEASAQAGDLPLDQGLQLRRRLMDVGLVTPDQPYAEFPHALGGLSQRLRALEDPATSIEPVDLVENVVAFPDGAAAQAFVDRLRGEGRDVDSPVPEETLRRWTVVLRPRTPSGDPFATVGPDVAVAIALGGWHLGAC